MVESEAAGAAAEPVQQPAAAAAAAAAADGAAVAPEALTPEQKAKKEAKEAAKAAKAARAAAKAAKAASFGAGSAKSNEKKAKAKAESEAKKAAEAEEVAAALAAARATPRGEKKDTTSPMLKGYDPPVVEAAWYDWWEAQGFFKPRPDAKGEPFVVVIPPPNVTGSLHLGHALTNAIQDTIIRWRRMQGRDALWIPGTDHAGIATQTVVEKTLKRERGLSRHDLGREAFMEEVFKWVEQYGNTIFAQLRRIGSSLDWSRAVFTMDAKLSAAVLEAFLRMHAMGLIYRDNRLVNWDCSLRTAVSDIEVEDTQLDGITHLRVPGYAQPVEFGAMKEFAYPLEDGSGELVVATTRIETMLGDTAVAVHPDDEQYKHLHGKHVIHPVDGRKLPIVCDAETVDMTLGTGAVKITPAHDAKDFATGKRHDLQFINILNDDGTLNGNCGPYAGRPRYEVRTEIVEFLEGKGLFRGTKPNPMVLGLCSRSGDVIEPLMRPQWCALARQMHEEKFRWVDCSDMAAKAKAACAPEPSAAVQGESFGIRPPAARRDWDRWLDNIRDWCISRQLWWGHRIPAFYVALDGEQDSPPGGPDERMDRWVVAKDEAAARVLAEERFPGRQLTLKQDEDVLDTWFSSGLFPFSVFGWPSGEQAGGSSGDLARYFPGALLETGRDILFFWVARMVMMSMSLTGKVPFEQVYLHAMVRDAHGNKMSKSLGNALDPVDVIEGISLADLHAKLQIGNLDPRELTRAEKAQTADFPDGIEQCGTDALRFALVSYTTQGGDINLDIKKVIAYRHWCNKLWNAIKFALKNLGENFVPSTSHAAKGRPLADRWILSRLAGAIESINAKMEDYDFGAATQAAYQWWLGDLCDVFIELSKPVLAEGSGASAEEVQTTRDTLWVCLDTGLRLLHPFMPFVTEELWQRLPRAPTAEGAAPPACSIMVADYPSLSDADAADWRDQEADAAMEAATRVVTALRGLRQQYGLQKQKPAVSLAVSVSAANAAAGLEAACDAIAVLSLSSSVSVLRDGGAPGGDQGVVVVDATTTAYLDLAGILDPAKEAAKLAKQQKELEGRVATLEKRQGLPGYAANTPENVRADDAKRLAAARSELDAVKEHLARYQARAAASK